MLIRTLVLTTALIAASSAAIAQQGTPQEEAACRPDVRHFCHGKMGADNGTILACLQEHRAKLRRVCREVLESHGQ